MAHPTSRPLHVAALLMVVAAGSPAAAWEDADAEFFEKQVRPLLTEHCFKCHGEEKQKGGLQLTGIGSLLRGGESGPTIVPGHPEQSLLIEAINYESFEMPPDGKLSDEQIAVLTSWVARGAPWPGADRDIVIRPEIERITDEDRQFWSFQPLQHTEPPITQDDGWVHNEIDRFIWSRLHEEGIAPAERASPASLIRRVYLDVTGLPPNPQQVDEFLADHSDHSYRRIVERLLKSPRHGEHMAHFWLDLVRYADSDGYKADYYRPDAWRYRDYVIQSFNDDKPYDRFILEQLAGDEIAPDDPQALAATGFLRHGIYEYNQRDAFTQWQDMLNDITDTTADVFLGLGMGCARCHDHKFDPLLQKDYYRLQAFFAALSIRDDVPFATPAERSAYGEQLQRWEEQTADIRQRIDELEAQKLKNAAHRAIIRFPEDIQAIMGKAAEERSAYESQIAHLVQLQVLEEQKTIDTKFTGTEKEEWEALRKQLEAFDDVRPGSLPGVRSVTDIGSTAPAVFIPGKERLGEIEPGFLTVLDEGPAPIQPVPTAPESTGRRTALAKWLTQPDHPLTSRVIVNRVWRQYFGTGLVATPSDFGRLGDPPSHPELLDWLALHFVESGWSLKWLHQKILESSTYQQTSLRETPAAARKLDPANRLLWRQNIRRLDAEQIRDSMLAVTGELSESSGGPGEDHTQSRRRTIYTKLMRNQRDELLTVFDLPDRITSTCERNETTTPTQSLLMLNSPLTINWARAFAMRLQDEVPGSDDSLVRHAYNLALCREPTDAERSRAAEFLATDTSDAGRSAPIDRRPMPNTGSPALVLDQGHTRLPLLPNPEILPTADFSISAVVLLNSLYPDASVRTIVSHWDSDTGHRGWSLGVTSTRSAYQPGNLILQLVGDTADGNLKYEVVPSGLYLEPGRPYFVSATVRLDDTSAGGVSFVVQDLSIAESPARQSNVKHQVVSNYHNSRMLVIGGRDGTARHRWDGLIDEVRLTASASDAKTREDVSWGSDTQKVGSWGFNDDENALADESGRGHNLSISDSSVADERPRLVDFCHVLLNASEFLYVD